MILVRWEDRVAVEDAETGEQIRYGQLASKVGFSHTHTCVTLGSAATWYVTELDRGRWEPSPVPWLKEASELAMSSQFSFPTAYRSALPAHDNLGFFNSNFNQYPVVVLGAAAAQCVVSPMNSGWLLFLVHCETFCPKNCDSMDCGQVHSWRDSRPDIWRESPTARHRRGNHEQG